MLVSVSGVVGWATGPPQRVRFITSARVPTLKTYTTLLRTVRQSGIRPPDAGQRPPRSDLYARSAGTGTPRGWTPGPWERVAFSASPGDFPRGRPALNSPTAPQVPADGEARVVLPAWSRT
ncbi:hypothetical protein KRMM14A1259_66040 [Krasilnikovia sp. MM14-A1259]